MPPAFAAIVLFAAAAASVAPALVAPPLATAPIAKAAPPSLSSTLSVAGFGTPLQSRPSFMPLQGLPAVGDTAPQCRSTCVKSRAICGDEQDCSDQWRQCVTACANPIR